MSTTAAQPPTVGACGMPPEPVTRLTVEQYHEMARAGILPASAPLELLEGWLVRKMTKDPPHALSVGCTGDALVSVVGTRRHVRTESPITTADSEPEPDLTVVRGVRRDYVDRHPGPAEVELVVEVADTSLDRDRRWKKTLYAVQGIPVYWIINLVDRQIEVFTRPTGPHAQPDYADCRFFRDGEQIPVVLDGIEVGRFAVADLLP